MVDTVGELIGFVLLLGLVIVIAVASTLIPYFRRRTIKELTQRWLWSEVLSWVIVWVLGGLIFRDRTLLGSIIEGLIVAIVYCAATVVTVFILRQQQPNTPHSGG
jgi:uncharacterized membrane protein HdeD (DUF308 family)